MGVYCSIIYQINTNKKEGTRVRTQLQQLQIEAMDQSQNLSVVMDSDRILERYMMTFAKVAFCHVKSISRVKELMFKQDLKKLSLRCVHLSLN